MLCRLKKLTHGGGTWFYDRYYSDEVPVLDIFNGNK